jgi:dTDP-4-dehydrorhamnose 3,5-epimerase
VTVTPTAVPGAFVVEPAVAADERGWFAELYQLRELAAHGCEATFVRTALSFNARRGTLRGLHFQREPHGEAKLVTCIRGAVHDVFVDVRPDSPAFGRWDSIELTEENRRAVFLPRGFAHGFQTLVDGTTLLYHLAGYYVREAAGGVRWDDPGLAIAWPLPPAVLSEQDRGLGVLTR